jgi:hypothetical protein
MAVEIIRDDSYRIIVLGQEDKIVYPNNNESSLLAAVADALAQTEKPIAPKPATPARKRGRPVKKKPVKETENVDS